MCLGTRVPQRDTDLQGLYRRTFRLPAGWAADGRTVHLVLKGASSAVYAYVDGPTPAMAVSGGGQSVGRLANHELDGDGSGERSRAEAEETARARRVSGSQRNVDHETLDGTPPPPTSSSSAAEAAAAAAAYTPSGQLSKLALRTATKEEHRRSTEEEDDREEDDKEEGEKKKADKPSKAELRGCSMSFGFASNTTSLTPPAASSDFISSSVAAVVVPPPPQPGATDDDAPTPPQSSDQCGILIRRCRSLPLLKTSCPCTVSLAASVASRFRMSLVAARTHRRQSS